MSAVELDLDGQALQVAIGLDNALEQSLTCQNVGQQHWPCGVDNAKVSHINRLRVIAVK